MQHQPGKRLIFLILASMAINVCGVGAALGATATKKKPAKPAKTPAKPATKPAAETWVTKTAGRVTFSEPSNWKQDKSTPAEVSAWYTGQDVQEPEAGFAIMWVDVPMESLLNSKEIKKLGQSTVSGIAMTEYSPGDKVDGIDGIVMVADKAEADGKRVMITAVSMTGQFKKHEPTLRKIVASIKIKEAPAAKPLENSAE